MRIKQVFKKSTVTLAEWDTYSQQVKTQYTYWWSPLHAQGFKEPCPAHPRVVQRCALPENDKFFQETNN